MRALIARVLRRVADWLEPSPRRRRPRWPAAPVPATPPNNAGDDQLSRLRRSDIELARSIGVAKTTISSWRRRGVPYHRLIGIAQQRGVNITWMVFGERK